MKEITWTDVILWSVIMHLKTLTITSANFKLGKMHWYLFWVCNRLAPFRPWLGAGIRQHSNATWKKWPTGESSDILPKKHPHKLCETSIINRTHSYSKKTYTALLYLIQAKFNLRVFIKKLDRNNYTKYITTIQNKVGKKKKENYCSTFKKWLKNLNWLKKNNTWYKQNNVDIKS